MKKEFLIAFLAIGFIFAGAMSASAGSVTWTLVETAGMKLHSPGADGLLGTSDDGLSDKCNYSDARSCATAGNPTQGSYSFTELSFVLDSSCAHGEGEAKAGDACTENADCGGPGIPCTPCNPPSKVGLAYFAKNPSGGSRGAGTYTVNPCDSGYAMTAVAIGTSEVVSASGGSCMTLDTFNSATGCGEGATSTDYDLMLWTSTLGVCYFPAGTMPVDLAGRIYAAGTASTGICGYSPAQITAIMTDAVITSGYLSVMCGSGTLPSDLETVCIPGADWEAVFVAKTSGDLVAECGSDCSSGGCMAGTAEGVE